MAVGLGLLVIVPVGWGLVKYGTVDPCEMYRIEYAQAAERRAESETQDVGDRVGGSIGDAIGRGADRIGAAARTVAGAAAGLNTDTMTPTQCLGALFDLDG